MVLLTYLLDQGYNPAAEAFKNFDQDQSHSLIGSLHLDSEEEPRRGASRANSVRFDEKALHGHFTRPSTDFLPLRTGSGLGSHPMTERSSSHKSDGRQSSAGQSVHSVQSARASSFGLESRPLSATVPAFIPLGPPPGLFILGPVPSIIRCWLTTNFSNETLLYAAVCTASYKSILDAGLVSQLGYQGEVSEDRDGERVLKLPVYLPEATIQQSSSRSASPAPQLPTMTVDFVVQDLHSHSDSMQILLGCDTLRARSADIQFSLDRLTLFDDDRNKLAVPLVRPENAKLFQTLLTTNVRSKGVSASKSSALEDRGFEARTADGNANDGAGEEMQTLSQPPIANRTEAIRERAATPVASAPSAIGEGRRETTDPLTSEERTPTTTSRNTRGSEVLTNGTTPDTPNGTESGSIWGSWRRDNTQNGKADLSSATSTSGYQRAGRGGGGRGMKVLKPARLNTSRAASAAQGPVGFDAAPSRFGDTARQSSQATPAEGPENPRSAVERRSLSGDAKPQPQSATSKTRPSNPIGGASAFGWLNAGESRPVPAE